MEILHDDDDDDNVIEDTSQGKDNAEWGRQISH